MTKTDFIAKRKEYDAAVEGEEFDSYYEANEAFCDLVSEIMIIEEVLDEEEVYIASPSEYTIYLDDTANKQIQAVLYQLKARKIMEFEND